MTRPDLISRRSFSLAAACTAAAWLSGCTRSGTGRSAAPSGRALHAPPASPVDCPATAAPPTPMPLWETAVHRGLVYGSSTATWQISDRAYRALYTREAAILFTEDDLLWYRLRPTPTSGLRFQYGDEIVAFAHRNQQLVFGAHLVWDAGFGHGWNRGELLGMDRSTARRILFGTLDRVVHRYRGRVVAWSTVNEAIDTSGLRSDVPWFQTIGPGYVAEAFHRAHDADPNALLVLNDNGFETTDGLNDPADKRAATLRVLDQLLHAGVPVHALGVQAHLDASYLDEFDQGAYRRFLADVANRGLKILITEMDVLDDTLPTAIGPRDAAVADIYRRYLDVALDEPAVVSLMTFGLSDRYTWLQEDYPRQDGAARRPLPFDNHLDPKPAYQALQQSLGRAPRRSLAWQLPRC